jgi:hypothetical protein
MMRKPLLLTAAAAFYATTDTVRVQDHSVVREIEDNGSLCRRSLQGA